MSIGTFLKDCFQDRAILHGGHTGAIPDKAIILHEFPGTVEVEIARTKVRVAEGILDPANNSILSISGVFPPRVRVSRPGEDVSRSYIPVADWDGKNLRLAVAENTVNVTVRNALFAGLPTLLRLGDGGESGATLLRQKMSLGLTKERKALLEHAEKNRKHVEAKMAEIQKFLESANRQERIAAGLEKLEQGQLDEFAKGQWEDLQRLIPGVLQDVYVQEDFINAVTNPIVISGVLVGACRIQVSISTAKVLIFAIEQSTVRDGHCHPHVQHDGNPCWGNLERNITDMAAKRDYYGLVSATLRLLHQYVHDDAYEKLDKWGKVAATPEDGMSCHKYGPKHSYAQMRVCMKCEEACPVSRGAKIEACQAYHGPDDCKACTIGEGNCEYWRNRFSDCFKFYKNAAPAFCLLKCSNTECPYVADAQELCRKENLPKEGECPARTLCRKPCERR